MSRSRTWYKAAKFLNEKGISDDFLEYRFRLSDFAGGPHGFVERLISTLDEYGVDTEDQDTLYNVLLEIKHFNIFFNIFLNEINFWGKIVPKPKITGSYALIFEYLINVFLFYFLKVLGIGLGAYIPFILKKEYENKAEIDKQRKLQELELETFTKQLKILKEYTNMLTCPHEELIKELAIEYSKFRQLQDQKTLNEFLELLERFLTK